MKTLIARLLSGFLLFEINPAVSSKHKKTLQLCYAVTSSPTTQTTASHPPP